MSKRRIGLVIAAVAGVTVLGWGLYSWLGEGAGGVRTVNLDPPLSVPQGITIIDVMTPSGQFLWQRLGDANGKALYTNDAEQVPDAQGCTGECAEQFKPFTAIDAALAEGDFTLVARDDGSQQWVYQGRALYSYAGDDPPDLMSDGQPLRGGNRDEALFDPSSSRYSPLEGWRRAAFTPQASMQVPAGLELRSNAVVDGYVFVAQPAGQQVYALGSTPPGEQQADWRPVYAPNLGPDALGDFTAVTGKDGRRHWHYKGYALYTFRGDYSPGDKNGLNAMGGAALAMAYRNYVPEGVQIEWLPTKGPFMMTNAGLTLYTQLGYRLQYGGRLTRDQYRYTYADAKHVGTAGCVDECIQTWHPLQAPESATARGFWEVMTRGDGVRQWAYKGAALYTHKDDQRTGDLAGNNIIQVVFGDPEGRVDLSLTTVDDPTVSSDAGSAFYWRAASLIN